MDFSLIVVSVLSAFGLAVILVEKSSTWPVEPIVSWTRSFASLFSEKFANVFDCTVCMSFWTSLLVELFILYSFDQFYWPLTGFITLGLTWIVIEFLNAIDKTDEGT